MIRAFLHFCAAFPCRSWSRQAFIHHLHKLQEIANELIRNDLYQRTHSLRGICRMLLQEDSVHPALQKMRSDPDAFIDDLLMRMIPLLGAYDELCLDEAYRRYLAEDLRQWLRKIS